MSSKDTEDTVEYKPKSDENFASAAENAIALAKKMHKTATFQFNESAVVARENDTMMDVVMRNSQNFIDRAVERSNNSPAAKELNEALAAYRRTPEEYAADRAKEVKEKQAKIDDLVDNQLAGVLKLGLNALIPWIKDYAEVADDVGVDSKGKQVSAALTGAGYKESEYVGDKFVKGDKEILGRYIVGQAISCLNSGMPPVPAGHVGLGFVNNPWYDNYMQMPDKDKPSKPSVRPPPRTP